MKKRRKLLVLFGSIALVLVVSALSIPAFAAKPAPAPAAASSPAPDIAELLAPVDINPVIILQGSDYEMGYQYAQQLIETFGPTMMERFQREITDEQMDALKVGQWFLREYTPEMLGIIEGLADGATDAGVSLSYKEVLARYVGTTWRDDPPEGWEDEVIPGCSHWAAWGDTTTDGSLICANSMDGAYWWPTYTLVVFPDEGHSYIGLAYSPDLAGFPAMNSAGVYMGMSSGSTSFKPELWGGGWGPGCLNQHLIRFADSAEHGKDMLVAWPLGSSSRGTNFTFADVSGDAYVVEKTVVSTEESVRVPGDFGEGDFIYATNNFLTDEGGFFAEGPEFTDFYEHAGWHNGTDPTAHSVQRNLELYRMFTGYEGDVDMDFAKMLYRFSGNVPDDPFDWDTYMATMAAAWETISHLGNWWIAIGQPDDGNAGKMTVCTGPAAQINYPLRSGYDWYVGEHTFSFYEITLAANPRAVASAAQASTQIYLGLAWQELMHLNFGDKMYVELDELWAETTTEYWEGRELLVMANYVSGDAKLSLYAQATTAYARSMAHARQVYNALVPPADCPKDLGLKPYESTSNLVDYEPSGSFGE